ncbi:MAG TPA: protease inhibitor I42 family protein [Nitrolancea sp.]
MITRTPTHTSNAINSSTGRIGQKLVTISREAGLHVTLCSNPSTGFRWEPVTISDPTIIELRYQQYVGHTEDLDKAGFEDLLFDAKKSGTTTVSFHYSQPWAGGTKDLWSVTVEVTVSE